MPDGIVEYRCGACAYQIPLLAPAAADFGTCPECGVSPVPRESTIGIDSTGLLNLLYCGSCGCILGRYWGMIRL